MPIPSIPSIAPDPRGRIPAGYLVRGCLQCRFTLKLLLSPSLPGWQGPEPWVHENHSAAGLAPFSSATELPSAEQSTESPGGQPGTRCPVLLWVPARLSMGIHTEPGLERT